MHMKNNRMANSNYYKAYFPNQWEGGIQANSCNIYSLDVPAKGPRRFIPHVRELSITTSGIVSFCMFTCYLVNAQLRPIQFKFFLEFPKLPRSFTMHLTDKQMLKKVLCSNIASSRSSRNHPFYNAATCGEVG